MLLTLFIKSEIIVNLNSATRIKQIKIIIIICVNMILYEKDVTLSCERPADS